MHNLPETIALILMASFLLHVIGLFPLVILMTVYGMDFWDNFYLVKKIDNLVKDPGLRQVVYYPFISILGALFMGILYIFSIFIKSHPIPENFAISIALLAYAFQYSRKQYLKRHPVQSS